MNVTLKKILRKSGRILLKLAIGLVVLLLLVYILIQVPAVQNFGRKKIISYLENKLQTKVQIQKLSLDFPKRLVLENVYFEDQKKDTLVSAEKLRVDISLFKLLRNQVEINYLELSGATANIYRLNKDTVFNYDYIVKAFAGEKETIPTDSTTPMKFELSKLVLKKIHAVFKDNQTGNDADLYISRFETGFKTFDPVKSIFNFPKISIDGITAKVRQYEPLIKPQPMAVVEAKSNIPFNLSLSLDNIDFRNIQFQYDNNISALSAYLNMGKLITDVKAIDLQKLAIHLKKIELDSTQVQVVLGKSTQSIIVSKEIEKKALAQANNPWKIELGQLLFNHNELKFDNNNSPRLTRGIDFSHLHIKDVNIDASNMNFTPENLKGSINQLAFTEEGGFKLRQLQANFSYGEKETYLKNLFIKTDKTIIRNQTNITYRSLAEIMKSPAETNVDIVIEPSQIAVKDILLFAPSLSQNFRGIEQSVLKINGSINGNPDNIAISSLQLSGIGTTDIGLSGNIKNLYNIRKTNFDISLSRFNTSKTDLLRLMPNQQTFNKINIPETINTTGSIKGTMEEVGTNLLIKTNRGESNINGMLNINKQKYDIDISLTNLDVGYILKKNELLKGITLQVTLKGAGFDIKTASAAIAGKVTSAYIKEYNYANLELEATINKGIAAATARMKDKNIAFNLNASVNVNSTYPAVELNTTIETLNLHALKLIKNNYVIRGNIIAHLPVAYPDSLIGRININDFTLIDSGRIYKTDSIFLAANAVGSERNISFQSEALQFRLDGQYRLTQIPGGIQNIINKYYKISKSNSVVATSQNWKLYATLNPSKTVTRIFPQLSGSDTVHFDMGLDNINNNLYVNIKAPKIVWGKQKIDNFEFAAKTDVDRLSYAATLTNAGNKEFSLHRTSLSGDVANNTFNTFLDIRDAKEQPLYQLSTVVNRTNNGARFSLKPDLLLDYKKWTASNDNFIQYDSSGLLINNFNISQQDQSLFINSVSPSASSPIKIIFNKFRISTITSIAGQKELLMDGTVNGNAIIHNVLKNPAFTSDLTIQNLSYKNDSIGNVLVKVNNQSANIYDADVRLEGNGNDVQLNGNYNTVEGRMDLKLDIVNLNLATIKKFSADQLSDASGSLVGSIDIKETLQSPSVKGELRFKKAYLTPSLLGERFYLPDESVVLVATDDISFDHFTIVDSAGSKAVVDGKIYTNKFKYFQFDMSVTARNFRAVNSIPQQKKLFYGKLNTDVDITIKGNVNAPIVRGDIKVNKSTDFTLVLPSRDPEVTNREGVVRFVDHRTSKDSVFLTSIDSTEAQADLKGIDLTANIETDTAAQFTMVIDERNGDALKIKGKADLAATIDQSGKLSLTGTYEVQDGSYQLTFNFLNRKFQIQKGSNITWTGEPTMANVDITAVYETKAAPIDLVGSQLSDRAQGEINTYKQKIPFNVYLKMKGELLKPVISFDIALAKEEESQWKDVATKLEQVSRDEVEMNKQVFALLLLNRFVAENPFESAGGSTTAESLVRESASRILTDQLNQLASNIIKDVDLNLGIQSQDDYSTGERRNRTDLNVGISKRLLNDRLKVTVGSNFELEGPRNSNQAATNIAGDIAIDYQMSKDGRYMLRAYRKNKYEGVVEGQVVETGMSFLYTLDYNRFKELFQKKKQRRQKKTINNK